MSQQTPPVPESTTEPPRIATADLPECLSSATSKLVYLYIQTQGQTTVPTMTDALNLPTLTVYSILQTLEGYGLVTRSGDDVALCDTATPTAE